MVGSQPKMLRGEAERQRYVEFRKRLHLAIEPVDSIWPKAVCPAQPGSQMLYSQAAQPANRLIQSMIFKVEPLTNT